MSRQPPVLDRPNNGGACVACDEPDDYDDMVQCDTCDNWFHFTCAGVDESVTNNSWHCAACLVSEYSATSEPQRGNADEPLLNLDDEPRNSTSSETTSGSHAQAGNDGSVPINEMNMNEVDLELRLIRRERELLTRKRELENQSNRRSTGRPENNTRTSTNAPSSRQASREDYTHEELRGYGDVETPINFPSVQGSRSRVQFQSAAGTRPTAQSTLKNPALSIRPSTLTSLKNPALTSQHLAARHSIPTELPKFSGASTEWPVFYSFYEQTTAMCGFTNNDNLIRLQKCLTGDARALVEGQLTMPASVPAVMDTLKMVFGRPEYIVDDLMDKIRKMPPLNDDKLDTIVTFSITVKNMCITLEQAGLEDQLENSSTLREILNKIPPRMRLGWRDVSRSVHKPTVKDLSDWLDLTAQDICATSRVKLTPERPKTRNTVAVHAEELVKPSTSTSSSTPTPMAPKCGVCHGDRHKCMGDCKRFQQLNVNQRWDIVKKYFLCRICLTRHRPYCASETNKCGVNSCNGNHHILLHYDKRTNETVTNEVETQMVHASPQQKVICRVVPVKIKNGDRIMTIYAFLDGGSTVTMIEDWVLVDMNIEGDSDPLHLRWTGGATRTEDTSRRVVLTVEPPNGDPKPFIVKARSVRSLDLPRQDLDVDELKAKCPHLRPIPVRSYRDIRPAMIIGLDNWRIAAPLQTIEGYENQPIAIKSRLGWAIEGKWSTQSEDNTDEDNHVHVCECNQTENERLHDLVKSYYDIDHLPKRAGPNQPFSMNDLRDLNTLNNTVKLIDGHYQAGLLWKFKTFKLPDSLPMALRRWHCLARELQKDEMKAERMNEQIEKLVTKGYARRITPQELNATGGNVFYLPIFPVMNPNKPGKVRVVFDAAATVQGVSLNSFLSKGPDLTNSLFAILLNSRRHKVNVCGDVEEMFLRIKVRPEDQHAQRFLYVNIKENRQPDHYVLQCLTFGPSCSPSIAQHVRNVNADRFSEPYPAASYAIKNETYMDDTLTGEETDEKALELAENIRYIYNQANFNIRNWRSNSKYVQQTLEPDATNSVINMDLRISSEPEKILGMFWVTNDDSYVYSMKFNKGDPKVINGEKRATKRELLRVQMSIFDPLGLIAHYIVQLKILVQSLWRTGSDWDTPITDEQQNKFLEWLAHLHEVEKLKIMRCYLPESWFWKNVEAQLHIFVDASEHAYASAAYLRLKNDSDIKCVLVSAKTRVAPIKYLSIPRMELNAAQLGAHHANTILESLKIKISKVYYWSDAKTVLIWLRSDARANPPYVAYRIADIQNVTDIANWRYVPSSKNVADEATKPKDKYTITYESRWFEGPDFLYKNEEYWPQDPTLKTKGEEQSEVMFHQAVDNNHWIVDPDRFKSWTRMIRVLSWCKRFSDNSKRRASNQDKITGPLTADELARTENIVYKLTQYDEYSREMEALKLNNLSLLHGNKLLQLNPFLDSEGVMRSRTRLNACLNLSSDAKTPIILPQKHRVTTMIITHYHERLNHQLHETTMSRIRRKYWIPRLRSEYKKHRRNCSQCKINNASPVSPQMASLPEGRVTIARPFTHVGVDYFGPIKVAVGRRVEKRYGALFTCLSTRAIHMELAYSLSTDSFIICFQLFMNRRGPPRVMYSDRGTNFIGAEKELREGLKTIDSIKLAEKFTSSDLEWKFNPPIAPHMGGSWERLIRTVKTVLYSIVPSTRLLTDEILRQLLSDIEFSVNSRPLMYVSHENFEEQITANDILLGDPDGIKPLVLLTDDSPTLYNSWRRAQRLANLFWKRFIDAYLPTISIRSKWFKPVTPLKEGDLVMIVDKNLPRCSWLKGRIVETKKSRDGQIRSAHVQTTAGLYERPAVQIAKIDVVLPAIEGAPPTTLPSDCSTEGAVKNNIEEKVQQSAD